MFLCLHVAHHILRASLGRGRVSCMVQVRLWVSDVGRGAHTELGIVPVSSTTATFAAPSLAVLASASRGLHVWVKGTYQPVKRRVVHQVVHGVVQRFAEAVQLRAAGGQHTF